MKQKKSIPSPKGQIQIKIQRTSFYQDQTIVGSVFLNVKEPGFPAGIVQLRFVGKARATRTFDDMEYGQFSQLNKKFLNSSIHLHDFGKLLPIVQTVFPFEITLSLFTSTLQIGSNSEETIIEFYIVSEVVNQKNKLDTQIKFKLPIKIHRGSKLIPIPMNNIFRGDEYYCCCYFKKNIFTIIKMNLLKNEFKKLDSITINVEIDQSNCSQDMYMTISLIKTLVINFLPQTYYNTREIQKFNDLKCEGLQKRDHTVVFNLNYEQLESTQISTDIQLQYFLEVYIIPQRMKYKFPITIIGTEILQTDQQMLNYNQQDSIVGETVLFHKMASLHVNQQNFLKQEQIEELSMYNNLFIDYNYAYSNYHVMKNNLKPVKEVPINVMQKQTNSLQE